MADSITPPPPSGDPPPLLPIRAVVILLTALIVGAVATGLMYAAGYHVAEAILAGLGAIGATVVACNELIG
ncbi:MAG TPA: hypothetical protein VK887_14715 [Pseudonocardiaceae bacterium]|nr:hypothetical protein [Pseudonocardiaceae bacterium]